MKIQALLFCGLLAGCSSLAPVGAQEVGAHELDWDSYAAADIAAIQKEADDLDIDQLAERMDAMRDGVWQGKAPKAPANAGVSIELFVSSSFARNESSALLWRDAVGGWVWHRAAHDGYAEEAKAFAAASGVVGADRAGELDALLGNPERMSEVWYSPASTPLQGTDDVNCCFDGASSLMVIHRPAKPDEFIVQSCTLRWLNGQLINLIGGISRS